MKNLAINLLATALGMALAFTVVPYIILPIINGA
tara:strand:- start:436 stop:537 length:102 start_codon:yes stop_codon:yes gene_type:complete